MDVGVIVKAALDVNVLRSDPSGRISIESIPLVISEYDRNAIYEGAKICESTGGKLYIYSVLTWGPMERKLKDFENVIREALALGVRRLSQLLISLSTPQSQCIHLRSWLS